MKTFILTRLHQRSLSRSHSLFNKLVIWINWTQIQKVVPSTFQGPVDAYVDSISDLNEDLLSLFTDFAIYSGTTIPSRGDDGRPFRGFPSLYILTQGPRNRWYKENWTFLVNRDCLHVKPNRILLLGEITPYIRRRFILSPHSPSTQIDRSCPQV